MDISNELNASRCLSQEKVDVNPLKRKWIEVDYGDLLEVKVGKPSAPRLFKVHRDVIYKKSRFFAAAATENWIEGQQKIVKLPDVDGEIFATYLHWVYSDKIVLPEVPGTGREVYPAHIGLYLLADRLDDISARNAVMDILFGLWQRNLPRLRDIQAIYNGTLTSSKLRTLLVEMFSRFVDPTWLIKCDNKLPSDFLASLTVRALCERTKAETHGLQQLKCSFQEESEASMTRIRRDQSQPQINITPSRLQKADTG